MEKCSDSVGGRTANDAARSETATAPLRSSSIKMDFSVFNGGSMANNGGQQQGPRTGPEAAQCRVFNSQIVQALIPHNVHAMRSYHTRVNIHTCIA